MSCTFYLELGSNRNSFLSSEYVVLFCISSQLGAVGAWDLRLITLSLTVVGAEELSLRSIKFKPLSGPTTVKVARAAFHQAPDLFMPLIDSYKKLGQPLIAYF